MMKYTGHPIVDIGIATLTAFAGKHHPSQLTEANLEAAVEYMTCEYTRQPLKSFLTVAFPNSGFTQPAFEKTPERRTDYARRVLRNFGADVQTLEDSCVFTGEPAVAIAFGDKEGLPPGRAFRQHIPLTTGEDVINFHPYGDAGIPVSGKAMLAIQAFPLGCAKVAGRLLAVHSDNEEILLHFASTFLTENRRLIQLAQLNDSSKLEEGQYTQRTLLIETLLKADRLQGETPLDTFPISLTAYHLTNSGQGADLAIHYMPLQVIDFLRDMYKADNYRVWSAIVQRAWEVAPPNKKGGTADFQPRRNFLYDDLFRLPEDARRFLRTYFLRYALRYEQSQKNDPRSNYSLQDDVELVSWKITAIFLKRIMNMDKDRVEAIRQLGDQLAKYVSESNDTQLFNAFCIARYYYIIRRELIKANIEYVKLGNSPFLTFDPYIEVFEDGDEAARSDWHLARDLVLIRMVERLHELGWLQKDVNVIPTITVETTDSDY